jgi:hypothetical protein
LCFEDSWSVEEDGDALVFEIDSFVSSSKYREAPGLRELSWVVVWWGLCGTSKV